VSVRNRRIRTAGRSATNTPKCNSATVTTEIAAALGRVPNGRPLSRKMKTEVSSRPRSAVAGADGSQFLYRCASHVFYIARKFSVKRRARQQVQQFILRYERTAYAAHRHQVRNRTAVYGDSHALACFDLAQDATYMIA
jgi:hypothetical protein